MTGPVEAVFAALARRRSRRGVTLAPVTMFTARLPAPFPAVLLFPPFRRSPFSLDLGFSSACGGRLVDVHAAPRPSASLRPIPLIPPRARLSRYWP